MAVTVPNILRLYIDIQLHQGTLELTGSDTTTVIIVELVEAVTELF